MVAFVKNELKIRVYSFVNCKTVIAELMKDFKTRSNYGEDYF